MTAAVTDEMLDAIALTGTPDDVRAALRRYEGIVDWVLLICDLGHTAVDPLSPTRRIISTFATA